MTQVPPPSDPRWSGMIPPCCPINSCEYCKCDFRDTPWAKIPGTNRGCLACATPEKRREIEAQMERARSK